MCPQIACPRECIVALAAFVLTFLRCVFSNESSNGLPQIFQTSPQIIYLRKGIFTLVAMTIFSTVEYYVYLQIACMKRSMVTLAAIVMLFFCCVFAKRRLHCEKMYQAKLYNIGDLPIRIIYWCKIIWFPGQNRYRHKL